MTDQTSNLYYPDSICTARGEYTPRVRSVSVTAQKILGPRGGDLGYGCYVDGNGTYALAGGESARAKARRAEQLAEIERQLRAAGWTDDRAEAERLSQVHAQARAAYRRPVGDERRNDAAATARRQHAEAAVAAARALLAKGSASAAVEAVYDGAYQPARDASNGA